MDRLRVSSPSFEDDAMIPERHTCDGADVRPALVIEGVPPGTRTFAVIFDDPDSPHGTWVHWLAWDVPAEKRHWDEGEDLTRTGAQEGLTSWPERPPAYYGPCPGQGVHRYVFRVHALDTVLGLRSGATRQALEEAMDGHVLATGTLRGRYIKRANR